MPASLNVIDTSSHISRSQSAIRAPSRRLKNFYICNSTLRAVAAFIVSTQKSVGTLTARVFFFSFRVIYFFVLFRSLFFLLYHPCKKFRVLPKMSSAKEIATKIYEGQKPGTSGLRKAVKVFQQEHYTENFIQAILDALGDQLAGCTLVVGGDGRYYVKDVVQKIIRMAAANGVRLLFFFAILFFKSMIIFLFT